MFWVFDEVKRGIYKRTVTQEPENNSKSRGGLELPLSDTLAIKGDLLQGLVLLCVVCRFFVLFFFFNIFLIGYCRFTKRTGGFFFRKQLPVITRN